MTKDDFRKIQKTYCVSGAPNHVGIYGCGCCRMIRDLRDFKKWVRRLARARFKQETQKATEQGKLEYRDHHTEDA